MSQSTNFDFKGKYVIKADLRTITALHIGGTEEGFEIGGLDNPVIKDKITGLPYIPGSSLKGKLRSLLEWIIEYPDKGTDQSRIRNALKLNKEGKWEASPCSCGKCDVCVVFGTSAETHTEGPTRLTVLDAWPQGLLDTNGKRKNESEWDGTIKRWTDYMGEKVYTELKTENTIDRITSAANPRSMERVPADSIFTAEFIYDVYQDKDIERLKILFVGIKLLEDSTLGGSGSRGSGRVRFENIKVERRDVSYYRNEMAEKLEKVNQNTHSTAKDILDNFAKIFSLVEKKT